MSYNIDWTTLEQGSITYKTGITGSGDYFKIGRFIHLSGLARYTFTPNTDTIIANVSSLGVPLQECGIISRASGGNMAAITITGDGDIVVNNRGSANVSWAMYSICFVAKN